MYVASAWSVCGQYVVSVWYVRSVSGSVCSACGRRVISVWSACGRHVVLTASCCRRPRLVCVVSVCSSCGRRVVGVWSACGRRVVGMWSACGWRVVGVWSACGPHRRLLLLPSQAGLRGQRVQHVVGVWSACGRRVVGMWSSPPPLVAAAPGWSAWSACGQRVFSVWLACGRRVVGVWSACGPHRRLLLPPSQAGLRAVHDLGPEIRRAMSGNLEEDDFTVNESTEIEEPMHRVTVWLPPACAPVPPRPHTTPHSRTASSGACDCPLYSCNSNACLLLSNDVHRPTSCVIYTLQLLLESTACTVLTLLHVHYMLVYACGSMSMSMHCSLYVGIII